MKAAITTTGLGKKYRRSWALRECSVSIPAGRVTALVGPNGAGKTTFLHLALGLVEATTGSVQTLGRTPRHRPAETLSRVAFVAQDHPLYRGFSVDDLLRFGRALNPRWDDSIARHRIGGLGIRLDRRIRQLSGGQQAQVALAMALAKRPDLLLLDEPVASLDPLARREFMEVLMSDVAETGLTVVLSSHVVAELERVCDYLVILAASHVQLAGEIDDLLRTHTLLVGPADAVGALGSMHGIVHARTAGRQAAAVVQVNGTVCDPAWQAHDLSLEELVLAYLRNGEAHRLPRLEIHAPVEGLTS